MPLYVRCTVCGKRRTVTYLKFCPGCGRPFCKDCYPKHAAEVTK